MNDNEQQENAENKAKQAVDATGATAEIVAVFYNTLLQQGICRSDALALTAEYMRIAIRRDKSGNG